jgi:hypothetical protein
MTRTNVIQTTLIAESRIVDKKAKNLKKQSTKDVSRKSGLYNKRFSSWLLAALESRSNLIRYAN